MYKCYKIVTSWTFIIKSIIIKFILFNSFTAQNKGGNMNRHDEKWFITLLLASCVVMWFCVAVITYAFVWEPQESSVVLIESQSIVEEQKLLESEKKIEQLEEVNNELEENNAELQKENEELKKSTALAMKNGNYYLE